MQHAAPRNSSSSLRRALGLIEVVATRHAGGGCTLTELAADAGLARSTVARLVAPLLDHGYVEVEPASGRHRLGAAVARLGSTYLLGPDYLKAVRAPLPDIPIVPTGGVGTGSVGAWLDAGACAVGMGSPLIGDALTLDGHLGALAERARAVCAAVAGAGR